MKRTEKYRNEPRKKIDLWRKERPTTPTADPKARPTK